MKRKTKVEAVDTAALVTALDKLRRVDWPKCKCGTEMKPYWLSAENDDGKSDAKIVSGMILPPVWSCDKCKAEMPIAFWPKSEAEYAESGCLVDPGGNLVQATEHEQLMAVLNRIATAIETISLRAAKPKRKARGR